ncbi:MAG: thiamine pyrophosphate-binding protein [Pseudomonadota bacterium]
MTGAEILAQKLAAAGCKRAFGIPGGEVLALIDALDKADMKFILTKHENAAGFMAEGGWHADGAPGVLIATLGPGVANAVNVVANAMQDHVPLLFLTGCVDWAKAERYTHQVFDHRALLSPIVKASFRAEHGSIGLVAEKALAIACEDQPGPVHIDLPIEVAEHPSKETVRPLLNPVLNSAAFSASQNSVFNHAILELQNAKKPIAIAGLDAVNGNASGIINIFCHEHNIPLITTYKAKGIIDEEDPLVIGGVGLSPKADQIVLPLLENSDCIVLLGYDPIEMRAGWCHPWTEEKTVIEISPVLRTHGMHWVSHRLHGQIVPTLTQVHETLNKQASSTKWQDGEAQTARDDLRSSFMPRASEDPESFGPEFVFSILNKILPKQKIATADSGAHRILLSQIWTCHEPRSLLQSTALCTMGCAVPLAMGYKLAKPSHHVVAFVGDAGLEMVLGELATLRDLKLPILIVVLVDESLALIELKQRAAKLSNLGVDFYGSDFPAITKALGGYGCWIDTKEELEQETKQALSRDTFTVLACRIGQHAYDGKF